MEGTIIGILRIKRKKRPPTDAGDLFLLFHGKIFFMPTVVAGGGFNLFFRHYCENEYSCFVIDRESVSI